MASQPSHPPQQGSHHGARRARVTDRLALLSEMTRLRLLRLLEAEELGVSELAQILQAPQSTVSRHLKPLLEQGWLTRRSEGTASRYRLLTGDLPEGARELWLLARRQLGEPPQIRQDESRLKHVLAQRRTDTQTYFGRVGGEWDKVREELFGRAFADGALLGLIPRGWSIADLGCGTGNVSEKLAPHAREVHAVDMSKSMLAAARKRLAGLSNVKFHHGDLLDLPLSDRSVDAAVISLVLHHVREPDYAIAQAARVLKPGGQLLVIDMVEHDRAEYRTTMGHLWLGFRPDQMSAWFEDADLIGPRAFELSSDPEAKGPGLFAASAAKPG